NRTHGDFIDDWTRNTGKLLTLKEGNFINREGTVLGKHKGVVNYTIGQRKGLGIALGKPAFVTELNADDNTVVLGDNEELFKTEVVIDKLFFAETDGSNLPEDIESINLIGKIRYAAPRANARVLKGEEEDRLIVVFETPQRAMTPGQSLVLYDGDLVIGGGRIIKVL
ncbi:MAG: tRNA 2-thiouridine(34) synthase MnmA, partial [Firmicutes bacterium]|nr:tRNA 2-thiouridine(34) synthase MnmA [Bacillota bacterium]